MMKSVEVARVFLTADRTSYCGEETISSDFTLLLPGRFIAAIPDSPLPLSFFLPLFLNLSLLNSSHFFLSTFL